MSPLPQTPPVHVPGQGRSNGNACQVINALRRALVLGMPWSSRAAQLVVRCARAGARLPVTLAKERTFLAWLRTALALLAAGIAVPSLGLRLHPEWVRTALSLLFVALSAAASCLGVLRWRAVDPAVRQDVPLPPVRLPWLLTGGCWPWSPPCSWQ